jgi:hypothetical protein
VREVQHEFLGNVARPVVICDFLLWGETIHTMEGLGFSYSEHGGEKRVRTAWDPVPVTS